MIARPRQTGLPLAVSAAAAAASAAAAPLVAVWVVLGAGGHLDPAAALALLTGSVVAAAASLAAGLAGGRLGAAIRLVRRDAVRRLSDPAVPAIAADALAAGALASGGRVSVELVELARTLDALHLRVRMADEVAERHRRTAETASAGMFELLSGLVAAEEGARGQLSAELHDTAAQTLMLARSHLAAATADPRRLSVISDLVAEAEEQVRAVMARTRPPELRDGDLAAAVGELRDDLWARYALEVRLAWPHDPHPLPLVTAVTVYRFFQEALLNVVKHADVDVAAASLAVGADEVTASVRDEGPGFDPDAVRPDKGRHVGLGLLRERARLAGGSLDVRSRRGDGTTVTLRIPTRRAGPRGLPGA